MRGFLPGLARMVVVAVAEYVINGNHVDDVDIVFAGTRRNRLTAWKQRRIQPECAPREQRDRARVLTQTMRGLCRTAIELKGGIHNWHITPLFTRSIDVDQILAMRNGGAPTWGAAVVAG